MHWFKVQSSDARKILTIFDIPIPNSPGVIEGFEPQQKFLQTVF